MDCLNFVSKSFIFVFSLKNIIKGFCGESHVDRIFFTFFTYFSRIRPDFFILLFRNFSYDHFALHLSHSCPSKIIRISPNCFSTHGPFKNMSWDQWEFRSGFCENDVIGWSWILSMLIRKADLIAVKVDTKYILMCHHKLKYVINKWCLLEMLIWWLEEALQ